jgi:hypothetical protein
VSIEVDDVFGLEYDRHIWARQVVSEKRRLKKKAPSAADFATAITGMSISDTARGSSTITLTIADPDWTLLDSGFFDTNEDGVLDAVEVNYPENSDLWWRLSQINVHSTTGATITMTFMERMAAALLHHRGPVKVSRAKRTRAEFMKMLTDKVKIQGGVDFHSRELHKKQPIEDTPSPVDEGDRKKRKDGGLNGNEKIKFKFWDGSTVTLNKQQLRNAEIVLDAAVKITDEERPVMALLCACIVEAPNFANPTGGDASSAGILQLLAMHGSLAFRRDIPNVVALFLRKGFWGRGGAIELARANPSWTVGRIAQTVQGSAFPDRYDRVKGGAEKVLAAYGGADFGGFSGDVYRKQYNFEVGTTTEPHETYWDAMNRLADEVNWRLFIDGEDIYYDSEMTLIKQKPVAIWQRDDPYVIDFDVTWDQRKIATDATMTVICNPFEFRAGEVVKLEGFGPASSGSTAKPKKLPGRWLIDTIERDRFTLSATITLRQPQSPKKEPASELARREARASTAGGVISGTPKHIIDKVALPIAAEAGITLTPEQVEAANARHSVAAGGGSGNISDHKGPPDRAWAADISNTTRSNFDRSAPTPEMDKVAKALAERFDIPWSGSGLAESHKKSKDGKTQYRFQLIYRTDAGGGHWNHVHIGVKIEYVSGSTGPQNLPGPNT